MIQVPGNPSGAKSLKKAYSKNTADWYEI